MIINAKGVSVNVKAGLSSVPNTDGVGAKLVSLINTHTSAALVAVNPDGTNFYVGAGERVVVQKDPEATIDGTAGGGPIWATAVGFTN
jgi:hypothetical protein